MNVLVRGGVIAASLGLAAIHGVLVPEHLEEKFYIGVLFTVGSVLLVLAAGALLTRALQWAGLATASLVAAGMFAGYVLSRTTGLPQGYKEDWGNPLGTLSLVLEVVLLGTTAVAARRHSPQRQPSRTGS